MHNPTLSSSVRLLRRARKIAQSQEKEAGEVTEAAKEAAQLSASALNTARRAKETLKNTQVKQAKIVRYTRAKDQSSLPLISQIIVVFELNTLIIPHRTS